MSNSGNSSTSDDSTADTSTDAGDGDDEPNPFDDLDDQGFGSGPATDESSSASSEPSSAGGEDTDTIGDADITTGTSEVEETTSGDSTTRVERDQEPTHSSREDDSSGSGPSAPPVEDSSPPFPYSDATQEYAYVRDGLWDDVEDMGFDAERILRQEFDIRNAEQREIDTALVELALREISADQLAEQVVRNRGYDPW